MLSTEKTAICNENMKNTRSDMRYTVLQYIINGYELVHEVKQKDPEVEYLLVTDDPDLKSETWHVIYDKDLEGLSTFDKCYAIKFNLFKYATTDICVYLDANIEVLRSLKPLIDIFEAGSYDMAMMPHPHRHNFIEEYQKWIELRGYSPAIVKKALAFMAACKYDFSYKGMFQGNFKIVRNDKQNTDF